MLHLVQFFYSLVLKLRKFHFLSETFDIQEWVFYCSLEIPPLERLGGRGRRENNGELFGIVYSLSDH